MKDNFDRALAFVLKWEGDYSHDPNDPGGETKWGISKRSHPDLDIKNLTLEQAKEIYRKEFWEPLGCIQKMWPYDLLIFDTAVNVGGKRARIIFQETYGWKEYLLGRIAYYLQISEKTHDRFLKGWLNRTMDLYHEIKKR